MTRTAAVQRALADLGMKEPWQVLVYGDYGTGKSVKVGMLMSCLARYGKILVISAGGGVSSLKAYFGTDQIPNSETEICSDFRRIPSLIKKWKKKLGHKLVGIFVDDWDLMANNAVSAHRLDEKDDGWGLRAHQFKQGVVKSVISAICQGDYFSGITSGSITMTPTGARPDVKIECPGVHFGKPVAKIVMRFPSYAFYADQQFRLHCDNEIAQTKARQTQIHNRGDLGVSLVAIMRTCGYDLKWPKVLGPMETIRKRANITDETILSDAPMNGILQAIEESRRKTATENWLLGSWKFQDGTKPEPRMTAFQYCISAMTDEVSLRRGIYLDKVTFQSIQEAVRERLKYETEEEEDSTLDNPATTTPNDNSSF